MVSTLQLLSSLVVVGSCSPVAHSIQLPPTSTSQAFQLVANITDLSKDLTPSVNHWKVIGVHIGAGQSAAVLSNNITARVFFENGTESNIGIAGDGGTYPWGLHIIPNVSDTTSTSYVDWFGIQIGLAQEGLGIRDGKDTVPQVYGPASGAFIICNETQPVYGRPQFPVKFARSKVVNGVAQQDIPDLCAPITLLPQCAKLDPLAPDAQYDHDYVRTVRCYDDVASIKW